MNIPAVLMQMRIIHIALLMGPTLFLGVIIFLFGARGEGADMNFTLSRNMVYISFAVYAVSIGVNKVLFPGKAQEAGENEYSKRLARFQTNNIIRTAIAEAGVLNMLVGLFLYASAGGALGDYSFTGLFGGSYLAYVAIWGSYFPNKEKLSDATGIPLESLR